MNMRENTVSKEIIKVILALLGCSVAVLMFGGQHMFLGYWFGIAVLIKLLAYIVKE